MMKRVRRATSICAAIGFSVFGITVFGVTTAQAQSSVSSGAVYEIINPGGVDSTLGERVDATTLLYRNDEGVAMTFNSSGLRRTAPYTAWWVIFNRPELCTNACACNFPDVFDPVRADAVQTSVFWATGRVTDKFGQTVLTAETLFNEVPDGDDQALFGPGLTNPNAEIHLVTRTHGRLKYRSWQREAQLTQFNGACSPTCFDTQVSVHRSPSCGP